MGFDPVSGIGTGCWPGMKRLSAYLFDRFGGWDLGCYNPRSMAGGGPSLHAEGRAQDFAFNAHDPDEMAAGDALFEWAVDHADEIGLQEILWRGFIWYYPRRSEGVRFGVQQADHMSHVHLGIDKHAGMNWDPSWVREDPAPVVLEDDRMKPELFKDRDTEAVYLYDPYTLTAKHIRTMEHLKDVQGHLAVNGVNADVKASDHVQRLLAAATKV